MPAPAFPGAQDLLQGLNTAALKLSVPFIALYILMSESQKHQHSTGIPPWAWCEVQQIQLGGGKLSLENLQPKVCCKVPSGAVGNRKEPGIISAGGERQLKALNLFFSEH